MCDKIQAYEGTWFVYSVAQKVHYNLPTCVCNLGTPETICEKFIYVQQDSFIHVINFLFGRSHVCDHLSFGAHPQTLYTYIIHDICVRYMTQIAKNAERSALFFGAELYTIYTQPSKRKYTQYIHSHLHVTRDSNSRRMIERSTIWESTERSAFCHFPDSAEQSQYVQLPTCETRLT